MRKPDRNTAVRIETALKQRRFGVVVELARSELVDRPGDTATMRVLLRALFASRLMEAGAAIGERLNCQEPSSEDVKLAILRCHFSAGAFARAESRARRMLAESGGGRDLSAASLFDVARVLRRSGNETEAEGHFRLAVDRDPSLARWRRIAEMTARMESFRIE